MELSVIPEETKATMKLSVIPEKTKATMKLSVIPEEIKATMKLPSCTDLRQNYTAVSVVLT